MTSQQKIEERTKKWQDLRQAVASIKVRIFENNCKESSVYIFYYGTYLLLKCCYADLPTAM